MTTEAPTLDGAEPIEQRGRARPTPKSAETRTRIVSGALQTLETHGLHETTTRRIAAAADVRLATLHYHFANKEAVLLAVLDMLVNELKLTLKADLVPRESFDLHIAEVLRASWAYVERTRAKQIVQYELTLYALRTQGSEWLARRQYEGYVDAYVAMLRDGARLDDTGLDDTQVRSLAHLMLAGIDGLILQALAGAADQHLRMSLKAVTAGAQAVARTMAQQGRMASRAD